jgi:transposase
VSDGTSAVVTYDRTVAWPTTAWTRQVTVTEIICGVDVSSKKLDARIGRDGPMLSVECNEEGVLALSAFCKKHGVDLVAMEATGGYEKLPFALLWAEGLACAIVNPRAVRNFGKAMGFFEKTDRIDCGLIAWFAEVKRIVAQEPAGDTRERLRALVTRLRQLTELSTAQKNQRRLVDAPEVQASIGEILALVRRQSRELEKKIAALLGADPLWRLLDETFRSIKGVAGRTVARVMAELPEIGTLSNKAIAKLAGLAPMANDSGQRKGKRPVRGGRTHVRSILFNVAEIVRRYVPEFTELHRRLNQAGKAKKVVRVALARKLLVWLNAKARDARKEFACAP